LFGRNLTNQKIFTWDTKSRLGVKKEVQEQLKEIEEDQLPFKQEELKEYKELYYLHLKHNDAIYTQNNEVEIFTDGTEKFTSLIHDLENANHLSLLDDYMIHEALVVIKNADELTKKARY